MTDAQNSLADRIDAVCAARGWSAREWSLTAGLSEGYLATYRSRSKAGRQSRLPEDGAEALARVARISVEWLRFGRGTMDAPATTSAPTLHAPTVTVRPPREAEVALLEAFRLGKHDTADVLAVLDVLRTGETMLPPEHSAAVAAMGRFLRAAARLRRDGHPVTYATLAWATATQGSDDELNAEAQAELASLGAEVPPRPRTPPLGVHAAEGASETRLKKFAPPKSGSSTR